jgi:hypothetical protein
MLGSTPVSRTAETNPAKFSINQPARIDVTEGRSANATSMSCSFIIAPVPCCLRAPMEDKSARLGGNPRAAYRQPLKKPFRETDPASTRENGDYSRRKAPRRRKSEAARAPTDRGLPPTLVSSAQPWAGGSPNDHAPTLKLWTALSIERSDSWSRRLTCTQLLFSNHWASCSLAQPHTAPAHGTRVALANQFDAHVLERLNHLHQRIDVPPN